MGREDYDPLTGWQRGGPFAEEREFKKRLGSRPPPHILRGGHHFRRPRRRLP